MKKSLILTLVLTAALVFIFTGCGGDQKDVSSSADENIQEELSAETPDSSELSADPEDSSAAEKPEKEDSSSVTSTGGADKPTDNSQKPSGGADNSSNTGNTGNSGSGSGNTNSDSGASKVPSKSAAQAYIGKSASSMIAAIGAPSSSQYSPSCMGDGEDGQLSYNGFTVYTYRENGQEKVVDVE